MNTVKKYFHDIRREIFLLIPGILHLLLASELVIVLFGMGFIVSFAILFIGLAVLFGIFVLSYAALIRSGRSWLYSWIIQLPVYIVLFFLQYNLTYAPVNAQPAFIGAIYSMIGPIGVSLNSLPVSLICWLLELFAVQAVGMGIKLLWLKLKVGKDH